MIDLLSKSFKFIATGVCVVLVVGFSAFVGARLGGAGPGVAVRSVGPTVTQLESLGELATTRVHVTDVLTADGDGYRGSWLIKGDAVLSCDLSKATIVKSDEETRTATIRLPRMRVTSPRLDHDKTKTWSVEKATWLPWKWGDEDRFRDSAMHHAQRLVETAAGSEANLVPARIQAEHLIRKSYELVGWHVSVEWQ